MTIGPTAGTDGARGHNETEAINNDNDDDERSVNLCGLTLLFRRDTFLLLLRRLVRRAS